MRCSLFHELKCIHDVTIFYFPEVYPLKQNIRYITFKDSVLATKKTQHFSITKNNSSGK
jgi:Zn/Cd-binding protein ZinT